MKRIFAIMIPLLSLACTHCVFTMSVYFPYQFPTSEYKLLSWPLIPLATFLKFDHPSAFIFFNSCLWAAVVLLSTGTLLRFLKKTFSIKQINGLLQIDNFFSKACCFFCCVFLLISAVKPFSIYSTRPSLFYYIYPVTIYLAAVGGALSLWRDEKRSLWTAVFFTAVFCASILLVSS